MRFDVITLFPEIVKSIVNESITGRAIKKGAIHLHCHQLRDYTYDKHSRVDDTLYGGGKGMLLLAEPLADCFEHICANLPKKPYVIYPSPKGSVLNQNKIKELSKFENITLVCGRYEGIDQRFIDEFVDEQISIGDYVLTGGEVPASIIIDSVSRMLPGVLSDEECFTQESHYEGLLECPHYTKPMNWRGRKVPEVLVGGNHSLINRWRREQSLLMTAKNRWDMLKKARLSEEDKKFLKDNGFDL